MSTDDKITQAAAEAIYPALSDAWDRIFSDLPAEADEVAETVLAAVRPLIEAEALREAAARLYPVPAAERLSAMAAAKEAGR